ncbi:MAG: flavodoxin [Rhodocyclaceae bacterium]|nr:flavodoxin [Rhodocyclaceae bacterium]
MGKIGIFFGTDTGRTRRIAKLIAQKLGEAATDPLNINRASVDDLLAHKALILGTPTLGDGELPGLDSGAQTESWLEFLPKLAGHDFSGHVIALFGLGDQDKYPDEFVDAIALLHDAFSTQGARLIGEWPTEGYKFNASQANVGGQFIGLALDQINQPALTETRLDAWLASIKPALLAA